MTAVPKPLKFLSPHYDSIKTFYKSKMSTSHPYRKLLADILSVLAMTMGSEGARECLHFKLEGNMENISDWGHEYIRSLAGEIGTEWNERMEKSEEELPDSALSDLLILVKQIVPFNLRHNAEAEAVDLLLEIGRLNMLTNSKELLSLSNIGNSNIAMTDNDNSTTSISSLQLDEASTNRVCAYLLKCADYVGDRDEELQCYTTVYQIYFSQQDYTNALRVTLRMGGNKEELYINEIFTKCTDNGTKRQLAYILGRHRVNYRTNDDTLDAIIGNSTLSELYNALGRDLDVLEPKTPEDIYKTHLAGDTRTSETSDKPDSAKNNLASTFVNAFVNAGFGTDKLMTPENSTWVYKNKDHGQISASASLGMVHLWNDNQLSTLDKFLYATEDTVKAGAYLGIGLCCIGTRNLDADPAFALLSEHISEGNTSTNTARVSATLGLALAYAGSRREEIASLMIPAIQDSTPNASFELACISALGVGLVYVGSGNDEYASIIADRLMSCTETEGNQAIARHMALGLGLLFLGLENDADPMLEIMDTIELPIGRVAHVIVQSCAFAATGNVLHIQRLLRTCAEHPEMEDKEKQEKAVAERNEQEARARLASTSNAGGNTTTASTTASGTNAAPTDTNANKDVSGKYMYQSVSVLGLALVAMGEELSVQLAGRMADHLLQYGDTAVRRVVPLALALCHISDPQYEIVDVLSKLSHDPNEETAQSAIFAMGIVGAGTNNSRIAGLLRTLATFYRNEADHLFIVRIAQGLLHMGKGLVTINPFHSDRLLTSPVALAGLLATIVCGLDFKATIHGKHTHLLYCLATAMQPRFVSTVDETGKQLQIEVRVGQAVETVGQAGRPKTITGFQTHTTPVLMGVHDRTELADDSYLTLTNVLEGVVVLRVNPAAKARKAAEEEAKEKERKAKLTGVRATRSDLTWG